MYIYSEQDSSTVRHRLGKTKVEHADLRHGGGYHRFIKRQKNRYERRKAKICPDCLPTYGRYDGYES